MPLRISLTELFSIFQRNHAVLSLSLFKLCNTAEKCIQVMAEIENGAYINCAEMVKSYFPHYNYLNSGPLQRPIVNGVWNTVSILSASKINMYKHVYQVSDLGMH